MAAHLLVLLIVAAIAVPVRAVARLCEPRSAPASAERALIVGQRRQRGLSPTPRVLTAAPAHRRGG
ncbi:MAG: hypothetical protein ACREFY_19115 [Acetobacteraceae bacterium]